MLANNGLCVAKQGMTTREEAGEQLRIIRAVMERATVFRALSGETALIGGGFLGLLFVRSNADKPAACLWILHYGLALLASRVDSWAFQELKSQLDMSDGNLITHLRTLEKAGFISGEKLTGDGRPQTLYTLTTAGRSAFVAYLGGLEQILGLGR